MPRPSPSIALIIASTLCVALTAGCRRSSPAAGPRGAATPAAPIPVTLVPVVRADVERTVDVTGTLFADEDIVISAKLAGPVVSVAHDVGDIVKSGDLLVELDRRDYELELTRARTALAASLARLGLSEIPASGFDPSTVPVVAKARTEAASAQAKFDRARPLFEHASPLISEQEFADIRAARDIARAQADVEALAAQAGLADARALAAAADIAQQRVRDTTFSAPAIAGRAGLRYRIAERMVSVGEYVQIGRPMIRLVASDLVKFRAKAPERFGGTVAVGAAASVSTDAASTPRAGKVSRIAPTVDPQSRTFTIEILLDNADGLFNPGAFARGAIVIGHDQAVPLVPAAAIASFAGIDRVYSVKDGHAVEHRIELGARKGDLIEIAGGFTPTQIVSPVPPGLAPGLAVR
jgi:RND family efflux transporter MFP subunit